MVAKKSAGYAHLHNHSEYSLLDGMQHIDDMFATAAEFGQPGVGITDHGTAASIAVAAKAAQKHGVKLVPGIEAYYVPSYHDLLEERARVGARDFGQGKSLFARQGVSKQRFHMTFLATTNEGFKELARLSSFAVTDQSGINQKYPLFDTASMDRFLRGGEVIATTGCIGSYANQLYLAGQEKAAVDHVMAMADIVGRENLYIEVMPHDFPDQLKVQKWHLELARTTGLPMLATNDTHYILESEARAHERFLAINTSGETLKFSSDENFFAPTEWMLSRLPVDTFGHAVANTLAVVERTTFDLTPTGEYHIPRFPIPDDYESEAQMLRQLCMQGLKRRYSGGAYTAAVERAEYELGVIDQMGFNGYFLILWDVLNQARSKGIRIGPGRGSAAGSVVVYSIGITDVDPLQHNLLFERFLNPSRVSMPDIDVDIEESRRMEVLEYVVNKYGSDHVAQIATYGTLKPKSALQDAARQFGIDRNNGWGDLFFTDKQGNSPITLAEALDVVPPERDKADDANEAHHYWENSQGLRDSYEGGDNNTRDALDFAADIQGYIRSMGMHAAGVIITPDVCTEYFPLVKGSEHIASCAYDKNVIDEHGLLKMDFLGLKNLGAISEATERIHKDVGDTEVDVDALTLDDPNVFAMLAKGDTEGVFQFESTGITQLLQDVQVSSFADISACAALYRPGPMNAGIHTEYAEAKRAGVIDPNKLIHPDLADLLKETFGLCMPGHMMIRMANGDTKRLEDVRVGDVVLSAAQEGLSARFVANTVTDWAYTGEKAVYRVEFGPGYTTLECSGEHKILTGRGWMQAKDIVPGDSVARFVGGRRAWVETTGVKITGKIVPMYDITVEGDHNYLANDFVVHNCVYQEQISAIAMHFAGYSPAEADTFRKAVGKKDKSILDKQEESFKARMSERGYGDAANKMWEMIVGFAQYAFNKSHSVAYGKIAYQTAWLKRYYPAQYGTGILKTLPDDKKFNYIRYLDHSGIAVLAPDVNVSDAGAITIKGESREKDSIVLGLSDVAGVGVEIAQLIVDERKRGGKFVDIFDFMTRLDQAKRHESEKARQEFIANPANRGLKTPTVVGLNTAVVVALTRAGALDDLLCGGSRTKALDVVDGIATKVRGMAKSQTVSTDDDFDLFATSDADEGMLEDISDNSVVWSDSRKVLVGSAGLGDPIRESVDQRSMIGFFVGTHPMEYVQPWRGAILKRYDINRVQTVAEVREGMKPGGYRGFVPARIMGVVVEADRKVADSAKPYSFVIEDFNGESILVNAFNEMRAVAWDAVDVGDVVIVDGDYVKDYFLGAWRITFRDVITIDTSAFPITERAITVSMEGDASLIQSAFDNLIDSALDMDNPGGSGTHNYVIRMISDRLGIDKFVKDADTGGLLKLALTSEEAQYLERQYKADVRGY